MNNIPAFPVAYGDGRIDGMTLRDYFAAKVMQTRDWFFYTEEEMIKINLKAEAKLCYRIANAMMEVRDE